MAQSFFYLTDSAGVVWQVQVLPNGTLQQTQVAGTGPSQVPVAGTGSGSRSAIIELANQLTERKGEKILNLNKLFASTCIDICKRGRHWWRKWDATFNLVIGQTTYDLTGTVAVPSLQDVAVEEIIAVTLILQANPLQTTELTPIFDQAGIVAMKNNATQGQPSRYTIDPPSWSILRVDPPDQAYLTEITFWAMPNLRDDSTSDLVPLIPPWHHHLIVEGLEAKINKRVYGANDARYRDAKESYEQSILTMMMRPQFTSNYTKQWVTDEDATRSTQPNSP